MKLAMMSLVTEEVQHWKKYSYLRSDYCAKWGYRYLERTRRLSQRPPAWDKIKYLEAELPNYEWLLWVDSDTLLLDSDFRIEDLIDPEYDWIISKDANGLNTGVFLIRNTEAVFRDLAKIWSQTDLIHHGWWEQAALQRIVQLNQLESRLKIVDRKRINMYPGEYKDEIPFILHFPGNTNKQLMDLYYHNLVIKRTKVGTILSQICKQQYLEENQEYFEQEFKRPMLMHRKDWEACFITKTLDTFGLLKKNSVGLGFACGVEVLIPKFLSRGCQIVATDQSYENAKRIGWVKSDQFLMADRLKEKWKDVYPEETYEELTLDTVDMNFIPEKYRKGEFDFTWSACSFEHAGDIWKGLHFVLNSMDALKPGGVAVYTTEYNVSSWDRTIHTGPTVLYRKLDLLELINWLALRGHYCYPIDFERGTGPFDTFVDVHPYVADTNPCPVKDAKTTDATGRGHLYLGWAGYVVTTLGLVIVKDGLKKMLNSQNA